MTFLNETVYVKGFAFDDEAAFKCVAFFDSRIFRIKHLELQFPEILHVADSFGLPGKPHLVARLQVPVYIDMAAHHGVALLLLRQQEVGTVVVPSLISQESCQHIHSVRRHGIITGEISPKAFQGGGGDNLVQPGIDA